MTEHSDLAVKQLEIFVAEWFSHFDQLEADCSFFLQRLAGNIHWQMPEGVFTGHSGFQDWYAVARQTFKPGCDHRVLSMQVSSSDRGYQLNLQLQLLAESVADNQPLNIRVDEIWQVTATAQGEFLIHDYRVFPLAD